MIDNIEMAFFELFICNFRLFYLCFEIFYPRGWLVGRFNSPVDRSFFQFKWTHEFLWVELSIAVLRLSMRMADSVIPCSCEWMNVRAFILYRKMEIRYGYPIVKTTTFWKWNRLRFTFMYRRRYDFAVVFVEFMVDFPLLMLALLYLFYKTCFRYTLCCIMCGIVYVQTGRQRTAAI